VQLYSTEEMEKRVGKQGVRGRSLTIDTLEVRSI